MWRTSFVLVLLFTFLTLSLTAIAILHAALPAEINSGRFSTGGSHQVLWFISTTLSAETEPNGDKIDDAVVTVNLEGPINGTTVSEERDTVYPNGTVAELGTGTFTGSFDGEAGSMVDNYTGSFTDHTPNSIIQNAILNDTVTFTDGNYGLTGLDVQVTEQAQSTSCNSQQTFMGQETICTGTGTYALVLHKFTPIVP